MKLKKAETHNLQWLTYTTHIVLIRRFFGVFLCKFIAGSFWKPLLCCKFLPHSFNNTASLEYLCSAEVSLSMSCLSSSLLEFVKVFISVQIMILWFSPNSFTYKTTFDMLLNDWSQIQPLCRIGILATISIHKLIDHDHYQSKVFTLKMSTKH